MKNKKNKISELLNFYQEQYELIQELIELINTDPENIEEMNSIIDILEYEHNTFLSKYPDLQCIYDMNSHYKNLHTILLNNKITTTSS